MKVCLLGASGSIGKQTIDVMQKNKDKFELVSFSLGLKTAQIPVILRKYPNVKHICVREKAKAEQYKKKYESFYGL